MPIPGYQTLLLPFLEFLVDGQEHTMLEAAAHLAERYQLTEEERKQLLPSGEGRLFTNRVAWAKAHLKAAGLIENPARGSVRLSDEGKRLLASRPGSITATTLRRYPSYLTFVGRVGPDEPLSKPPLGEAVNAQTPLEVLDSAYQTLSRTTADELLSRLRSCSPRFFEKAVVKLLLAMGYGGVSGDGVVSGGSGDGGIDGVIRGDKLGLDVVCVQAKRWTGTVGRPTVQGFVGSMDYVRAKKGVILTTSQFTSDAVDYVERVEGKKVVLIDGQKLTELMLEYDVGVTTAVIFKLKEVSNDFFDDEDA